MSSKKEVVLDQVVERALEAFFGVLGENTQTGDLGPETLIMFESAAKGVARLYYEQNKLKNGVDIIF